MPGVPDDLAERITAALATIIGAQEKTNDLAAKNATGLAWVKGGMAVSLPVLLVILGLLAAILAK